MLCTDNNTVDEYVDEEDIANKLNGDASSNIDQIDEVTQGMIYASLAITDDNHATLANIGKANPWHIEALKLVTGDENQAHKTLSEILDEDMDGLKLLKTIDISGITKGGQFLDTQGYIAYKEGVIVLSYRCTTSAFDWLTNFNTTSSQWEIEEDLAQGFSGYCSGFEGLCCNADGVYKPRVHTGFYNNFLASLPLIKQHIEPMLHEYGPPMTLYVVGHSLGAGIATLAACYFMLEFDWNALPHTFVNVTAGSPRAICASMKTTMDKRRAELGTKKARIYRVVKGTDAVVSVPPSTFGFRHLVDPVLITDTDGVVFPNSRLQRPLTDEEKEPDIGKHDLDSIAQSREVMLSDPSYNRMVSRIPKAFRDHMPDFYLRPLFKARGIKYGSLRPGLSMLSVDEDYDNNGGQDEEREGTVVTDYSTSTKGRGLASIATRRSGKSALSKKMKRKKQQMKLKKQQEATGGTNGGWVSRMFNKRKDKSQAVEPIRF